MTPATPSEPPSPDERFAQLEAAIARCQQEQDIEGEATARFQQALLLGLQGAWAQALEALGAIASVARQENQPALEAQAARLQAQILALTSEEPDSATQTPSTHRQAQSEPAAPAPESPEAAAARINHFVATFNRRFEQLLASPLMAAMPPAARAEMLWTQAITYRDIGQPDRAQACLEQALPLALEAENLDLMTRIQAGREALAQSPEAAAAATALDPYSQLLARTLDQPDGPIAGDTDLQGALRALKQRDFSACLQQAMRSYQRARDGEAPANPVGTLRYLLACVLIAFAREGLGDRAGVISILAEGGSGLEALGSSELAAEMHQLIEGLPSRWGDAAFQQAWQIYALQARLHQGR